MKTVYWLAPAAILLVAVLLSPVRVSAQTPAVAASEESSGATTDDLIRAILIKEAAKTIAANIDASKRESGELDKLIRAIAGVSVADIKRYGICGGPNSEVRKLVADLCH